MAIGFHLQIGESWQSNFDQFDVHKFCERWQSAISVAKNFEHQKNIASFGMSPSCYVSIAAKVLKGWGAQQNFNALAQRVSRFLYVKIALFNSNFCSANLLMLPKEELKLSLLLIGVYPIVRKRYMAAPRQVSST